MKIEIIRYALLGFFIISGIYSIIPRRKSKEKKMYFKWSSEKEIFKTKFLKTITKFPKIKYYIIDFEEYYIQYIGFKKSNQLYCEIVSNEYLDSKAKLKESQLEEILNLNFLKIYIKDKSGNISQNFLKIYITESINEKEQLINELIYLIEKMGIKEDSFLRIRYE